MIRSFSRETKLGSPWGTRRTQLSERRLLGKVNATPAPTFCVGAHLFPQSKSEIKVGIGYVTRLRMSVSYPTATVRSKPANSIIEANSRNEVGFTLRMSLQNNLTHYSVGLPHFWRSKPLRCHERSTKGDLQAEFLLHMFRCVR